MSRSGSPALTDGAHAGHDGDDGAVVVAVVKNVQHGGSITPNSWKKSRERRVKGGSCIEDTEENTPGK